MGNNVTRLIAERAAQLQVERAKKIGGDLFSATLAAMTRQGALQSDLREAESWVRAALAAARRAPGAEQWPTDEDMAGEILKRVKEKSGR